MKKYIKYVILVLILLLLPSTMVITKQNEYKVIKQFGKVVRIEENPGLSFKIPFIQQTQSIPNNIQLYDLAVSDVITKDKKTMVADSFALWRIEDPVKFITTLNSNVSTAQSRINTTVYNSLKNVISSSNQLEVITGRDGELVKKILDNIGTSFDKYGIELIAVETKMLDLPNDNKNAVYERMKSERGNIAASYVAEGEEEAKKIRNDADAEVTVLISEAESDAEKLIAEGEAKYMEIMKDVYNSPEKASFYQFIISLDSAKQSLTSGKPNTLIVDKNSPIADIFQNK